MYAVWDSMVSKIVYYAYLKLNIADKLELRAILLLEIRNSKSTVMFI